MRHRAAPGLVLTACLALAWVAQAAVKYDSDTDAFGGTLLTPTKVCRVGELLSLVPLASSCSSSRPLPLYSCLCLCIPLLFASLHLQKEENCRDALAPARIPWANPHLTLPSPPLQGEVGGRKFWFEIPHDPVGVLFMAHGCVHDAADFWPPSDACTECSGGWR